MNVLTLQRIGLLGLSLLMATPLSAQTKLAYQLHAGDVQRYVMKQSVATEMIVPGQPTPVESKTFQTFYLKISTDEVAADGTAKQRQTITRIIMSMTLPGPLNFEYDSAAAEAPKGPLADVMIRALKPLLNAEFKQTVDAQGKILEIIVPDALAESLKGNPGAEMLGEMATPEGMKKFYRQSAVTLPADPINVGTTWEQSNDNTFPFGTMTTQTTYKYLGPQRELNLEKVGIEVSLSLTKKEGSQTEVKLENNKGTGQILFDNRTGRLQENKMNQSMSMRVIAGGQTIDQKVVTEVTMRRDDTDAK